MVALPPAGPLAGENYSRYQVPAPPAHAIAITIAIGFFIPGRANDVTSAPVPVVDASDWLEDLDKGVSVGENPSAETSPPPR